MRRLVFSVADDGRIVIDHDNLSAGEMASIALIAHDLAMKVLKNGSSGHVQNSGSDDSSGVR